MTPSGRSWQVCRPIGPEPRFGYTRPVTSGIGTGLTTPGTSGGLISVPRYHYLLRRIVLKDIQVRYRGSLLGWLWSYAKPAFQFLVYFVAVGVFLRANGSMEAYPVYLFSGLVLLNFFSEAFGNATRSLIDNASLIKKIYVPRELFPVATTLIAIVNFLPQLVVLLVVCLVIGWHPSVLAILGILLAIAMVAVLATGLGMFFGAINVSFRDSQNFVDLILMVAVWGSPVLYQTSILKAFPDWLAVIYHLNPITPAVELMHYGFWDAVLTTPDPSSIGFTWYTLVGAVICALVLGIGQLVFRRLEGRFAQDL
jgi:ABC-2 type transport system permease protein